MGGRKKKFEYYEGIVSPRRKNKEERKRGKKEGKLGEKGRSRENWPGKGRRNPDQTMALCSEQSSFEP